jgi:eukaryotic-like serine/threonine-protein kinase
MSDLIDDTPSPELEPGTRIAPQLRIEQRIGAGAHGVVYRAHDDQLGRALAVKMQRVQTTADAIERLERQARDMARLSDPNVCIVHGAGSHDGRAFVVMELVDGGNAREWLRESAHDWREIVGLYAQAARGLAAAHAIGIVHGDFKPDNLLIGRTSGVTTGWRARVTDFGLTASSQLTSTISGRESASSTAERAYAAPELREGGATAASDQYSLCASLREALGDDGPRWLRRVIDRGLAHDPARRWPSIAQLADRLEAGLSGRSRRVAIAGTAIAGIAIAGGVAVAVAMREPPCRDGAQRISSVWQPARIDAIGTALTEAAGERGTEAWARARDRAATWVQSWIDGRDASCRATQVDRTQSAELLERSMSCFDRRAAELDATLATLAAGGRDAANHASEAIDALRSPASCSDERFLLASVEPPSDAATQSGVERVREHLRRIQGLLVLERIADAGAESTGLEASAAETAYAPLLGESLLVLGEIALQDDRAKEAIETLGRAHLEARQCSDADTATAAALFLARLEITHGDRAMARDWIEIARIEIDRGAVDPKLAIYLVRIEGFLARREGKYDDALALYRRALDLAIELDGEHLLAATVRDDISTTLGSAGRGPEAEVAFHETIAAYDRELGPGSPQTAKTHADRGLVLLGFGRPADAVAEERLALALSTELYGADSPRLFDPTIYLANALATSGDPVAARREAERALQLAQSAGVSDSTDVALALEVLGWCAFIGKDPEATIDYTRRADPLLRAHVGDDSVEVAQNLLLSAHASYELRRISEANEMLERSMAVWKAGGHELHSQAADAWALLSRVQLTLGKNDAAKESARKVVVIAEGGMVAPPILAAAQCCLAAAMIQTGDDAAVARDLAKTGAAQLREAGVKDTADDCDRWAAGESPR